MKLRAALVKMERKAFIARKNGEGPACVVEGYEAPDCNSQPLRIVNERASKDLVTTIHVSNFWPADVYKETKGQEPTTLVDGMDAFGFKCKGVIVPAKDDPADVPRRVCP